MIRFVALALVALFLSACGSTPYNGGDATVDSKKTAISKTPTKKPTAVLKKVAFTKMMARAMTFLMVWMTFRMPSQNGNRCTNLQPSLIQYSARSTSRILRSKPIKHEALPVGTARNFTVRKPQSASLTTCLQ
jgi:hypothetical protein